MLIPQVPSRGGIHYIWPGLQPDSNNFVFQDVSGDEAVAGAWTFAEWMVAGSGDYNKTKDVLVYPGDSIAICFALNPKTGRWLDRWETSPGAIGRAAGSMYSISDVIPPQEQTNAFGKLTQALFVIELVAGATWNFGPVTFSKIKIVAETTNTDWCSSPGQQAAFRFTIANPVARVNGNTTVCTIDSLVFLEPA
ncbi:hypothetical protein HYFRA_00006075 [Hymenoscyphus fraxineus]|uniref:Uncharacterized protein n=1 Tax=Hymenoscyphus fraxineus TaxID=746836 RepID=A0A9N9KZS6_9HELO|nr:hypothetical protein HYFRA_00006075 [Hymenoscyphus fraxineus]